MQQHSTFFFSFFFFLFSFFFFHAGLDLTAAAAAADGTTGALEVLSTFIFIHCCASVRVVLYSTSSVV